MATAKQINEAFLTTKSKNDIEIEKATYRNISRIDDSDVTEIHDNLMKIFNIKSMNDSKYFTIEKFKNLIEKSRNKKREIAMKKKHSVS